MNPLYKYLPLEYATCLVESGKVKLGTLIDYQNEDQYGKDIGDKDEGSLTEWSRISRKNLTQNDLNRIERQTIRIADGLKGVELNDCLAAVAQKTKDLYIYSTSRVFNVELMRRLSKEYEKKYNACVKINNPVSFLESISSVFKDKGKFEAHGLCCYMSRIKHHSKASPHPVFIKDPHYQYQEEDRAIWSPINSEKIHSEILEIPELKKYCELFFVDKDESTEDGIPSIKEKYFINDVVKIDSSSYLSCVFKETEIVFCAEGIISLDSCEFHNCIWTFNEAAKRTLDFMKAIHNGIAGDGKIIVENIFESIRKNA